MLELDKSKLISLSECSPENRHVLFVQLLPVHITNPHTIVWIDEHDITSFGITGNEEGDFLIDVFLPAVF